jgi:serine/threonine-protein kinase
MSPEQALGRKLDHRSDVFSLGSCLYEMLTRIPPFTASNEMDLLIKVRDAKYRPVGELTPGIPNELEQITDKCLTRSRANRYQTAAEVEGDLRSFLKKFMPNYSRSHLGRFIRKSFAQEIERELRMLEEYVLTDDVSDDVGENLMGADENFDPPEVPFQPKPTSVSILAARAAAANDFSGDSNFTTMPKAAPHEPPEDDPWKAPANDIHGANTLILDGRGRNAPRPPTRPPTRSPARPPTSARGDATSAGKRRTRSHPPPPPPARGSGRQPIQPIYDDDVHSAPTMIIDLGRMRGRRRG